MLVGLEEIPSQYVSIKHSTLYSTSSLANLEKDE